MLERSLSSCLWLLAVGVTTAAVACTADITGQGDAGASAGAAATGAAGTLGAAGTVGAMPLGAQPSPHLHKLTAVEFESSLHDLLGADAPVAAVEPDTESDGFASVGAPAVSISPARVGIYEA